MLTQPYLMQAVRYIHFNPQKHALVSDFRAWPYSSYRAHLSTQATRLRRDDVLEWFGGREGFIIAHQEDPKGLGDLEDPKGLEDL